MASENGTKASAFDSRDKKAEFSMGGTKFTMHPLNLKGLRKIIKVVNSTIEEMSKLDTKTSLGNMIETLFFNNCIEIVHIIFPESEYKFMTDEFIEENIDLPTAREIIEKAIEINSLADLYPFLKKIISKGSEPSKAKTGS